MVVAALPARAQIEDKYKWDLSPIYPSDEAWEAAFVTMPPLLTHLESYSARLGIDARTPLDALALHEKVNRLFDRLWQYAARHRDQDMTDAHYQGLFDRANQLATDVEEASAFLRPELVNMPEGLLSAFMAELPELRKYEHYFDTVLRNKPHLLSISEETLLARTGDLAALPQSAYRMLSNGDLDFGTVVDETGLEVELTAGRYHTFLASKDRTVREQAYRKTLDTYQAHRNTFAALFSGNVQKNNFLAHARKHRSALEAALYPGNVPVDVYDALITTVHKQLPLLHRYMALRKRALSVDRLKPHDLLVSLAETPEEEVPYDKAVDTVLRALAPLGTEYTNALREGLAARWVDVYETPNKRTSAHSGGCYDTYPYTMLNYQPRAIWRNTLAHELGHAMNSYFTFKSQPYIYAYASDFTGETAATVNEQLLQHYLLERADNPQQRLALLTTQLENFRYTMYRQTLCAEFERDAHEAAEAGGSLTADKLSEMYTQLVARYYGPDLELDDLVGIEWASIPHFYLNFMVYQYATAQAAAIALAQQVIDEGEPAARRYRQFLSVGDSAYPINLLRDAGVDMCTSDPVDHALEVFEKKLDEAERIVAG